MTNAPVRVVSAKPTPRTLQDSIGEEVSAPHSLHLLAPFREVVKPHVASYFIDKLSVQGETVCDPFCGSGSIGLETYLARRVPVLSDTDPLGLAMTEAKLKPADLAELTLTLQSFDLNKPVSLELYKKGFSSFFDIDTFREITNIRQALLGVTSRASVYCRGIAASLLHGHTAGYLSVYTFPHLSLSPSEQERLSANRGASPSYRAVVPRILRKAALLARDCTPSMFSRSPGTDLAVKDPRNLSHLHAGSIDLLLTAPPVPKGQDWRRQQWLRRWFFGLPDFPSMRGPFTSIEEWENYCEALSDEFARITKVRGHAVLFLREDASRSSSHFESKLVECFCRPTPLSHTPWSHVSTLPIFSRQKRIGHNGVNTVLKPTISGRAIVLQRKR